MDKQWFAPHTAYSIAKLVLLLKKLNRMGMSLCVLGMSEEFRPYGVAVNALWPLTIVWTAAMDMVTAGQGEKVR